MFKRIWLGLALSLSLGAAQAADIPAPAEGANNPLPTVPLNTFQRFEMAPVAMGAPFAGQKGNEVARERLQANLDLRVGAVLTQWNTQPASGAVRTLKIEPEIRYVRFITGGKRFFAGGFAGDSSLMVKVKLTDKATGEVIGEPDFYQHANALGAAWSFGATDKTMLIRISTMLREYLKANYDKTVPISISNAPDMAD